MKLNVGNKIKELHNSCLDVILKVVVEACTQWTIKKQVQNTPNTLDALGHASFQCEQISNLLKRKLSILKLGKMILQSRDLKKDCHRRMPRSRGRIEIFLLTNMNIGNFKSLLLRVEK